MLGNSRHHHGTLVKRRTSSLGAAALKGTWSWHYSKLQNLPWENPMVWAGLGHPFCRTIYGFITVFLAKRDHFGIQNHLFLKKTIETSQTPSLALLWPIFGTKIPPLCIASRSPGQPLRAQQFPPRMRQHWQHRETVCPALRDSWSREHFLCSHICHKCLRPCSFCQKNGRDRHPANLFLLSTIISVQVGGLVGEIAPLLGSIFHSLHRPKKGVCLQIGYTHGTPKCESSYVPYVHSHYREYTLFQETHGSY